MSHRRASRSVTAPRFEAGGFHLAQFRVPYRSGRPMRSDVPHSTPFTWVSHASAGVHTHTLARPSGAMGPSVRQRTGIIGTMCASVRCSVYSCVQETRVMVRHAASIYRSRAYSTYKRIARKPSCRDPSCTLTQRCNILCKDLWRSRPRPDGETQTESER